MPIDLIRIDNSSSYEDLMDFARLHTTCAAERWGSYVDETRIEGVATGIIENREKEIFVLLKKDSQPIGSFAAEIKEKWSIRLWSLFVDPQERNKGIASQALTLAQPFIKELWYTRMYAHIDIDNKKPQNLAQKIWYTKTSWENGSLEEREYIMK